MFRNKNKIRKELRESFGKIKAGSFYFDEISAYHQKKNKADAFQVLSEQTCNDLDFYHFCENVSNDDIVFDYKLKSGAVKEGNAIKMLKVLGYPESVIREASDLVKENTGD